MEDDERYVYARRTIGDYTGSTLISIDEIGGVKWDFISGGVHQVRHGYSLYGYVSYSDYKDKFTCSGRHDYGYNDMKICIAESWNKKEPYRSAYKELARSAGPKPVDSMSRPAGCPPCTKRILEIVKENGGVITRGVLRESLQKQGYSTVTMRNALKSMSKDSRVILEGSSSSKSQIIKLASKK